MILHQRDVAFLAEPVSFSVLALGVSASLRGLGSRDRRSRVRVWRAWRRGHQSAHRGSRGLSAVALLSCERRIRPTYWVRLPLLGTGAARNKVSKAGQAPHITVAGCHCRCHNPDADLVPAGNRHRHLFDPKNLRRPVPRAHNRFHPHNPFRPFPFPCQPLAWLLPAFRPVPACSPPRRGAQGHKSPGRPGLTGSNEQTAGVIRQPPHPPAPAASRADRPDLAHTRCGSGRTFETGQIGRHRQPQLIGERHRMIGRDGRQFGGVHHAQTLRPHLVIATPGNVPGAA